MPMPMPLPLPEREMISSRLPASWSGGGCPPPSPVIRSCGDSPPLSPVLRSSSADDLASAPDSAPAPAPAPAQSAMLIRITDYLHQTCHRPGFSPRPIILKRPGLPHKRSHTKCNPRPIIFKRTHKRSHTKCNPRPIILKRPHKRSHTKCKTEFSPLSIKPNWCRFLPASSHLYFLERKPTATLSLSPDTTVGALKNLLQCPHHPAGDFILLHEHGCYYPTALPSDATTLAQYGVRDGDSLRITSPSTIMVLIYNATNNRFSKILPTIYHTVSMVKELIYEVTNHPPQTQILMAKHLKLHEKKYEDRTLISLGFKSDAPCHRISLLLPCPPDPYAYRKIGIQFLYRTSTLFQVTIPINPQSTINEFKTGVIFKKKHYYITFGNMRLKGSRTFSSYNIKEGDLLEIWEGYSPPPRQPGGPLIRDI